MTFNIIIVATVILLGILFLLIEIFLLPGISIAGIAGLVFIIGGIAYAYVFMGTAAGNITLLISAALLAGGFIGLLRSKTMKKIALTKEIDSTIDTCDLKKIQIGDQGITLTRLNPIGKVGIKGLAVEGKSADGELIDEGTRIEVVKVNPSNITVKRKETTN